MNILEWFFSKILEDEKTGCWIWASCKNNSQYPRFNLYKKSYLGHRFAYELFKGKIPDGLVMDHLCRIPACVNPEHLEAVTNKENTLRGIGFTAINAKKMKCPQGHEYSWMNTLIDNYGKRSCRTCRRLRIKKYQKLKSSSLK